MRVCGYPKTKESRVRRKVPAVKGKEGKGGGEGEGQFFSWLTHRFFLPIELAP